MILTCQITSGNVIQRRRRLAELRDSARQLANANRPPNLKLSERPVQDSNLHIFLLQRPPLNHSGNRPYFGGEPG
jgi:hypothetical protein